MIDPRMIRAFLYFNKAEYISPRLQDFIDLLSGDLKAAGIHSVPWGQYGSMRVDPKKHPPASLIRALKSQGWAQMYHPNPKARVYVKNGYQVQMVETVSHVGTFKSAKQIDNEIKEFMKVKTGVAFNPDSTTSLDIADKVRAETESGGGAFNYKKVPIILLVELTTKRGSTPVKPPEKPVSELDKLAEHWEKRL